MAPSVTPATALDGEAYALFACWLDADVAQRALLLQNVTATPSLQTRLLALIQADREADAAAFLADNAMLDVAAVHAPANEADASGQRFGPWTLLRRLGSGGMGQVWLAQRNDGQHHGQAAIKMLRVAIADERTNQRFAQEGQILARLTHPHIAMLLDAGFADDGQRYLVLEYVDGERIDRWCDARRLDLRARITLFLQVCAAVSYAHAHLIVHRDLKPSNILVLDDGTAKLLDFGIAKLLADELDHGTGLTGETLGAMTPGYAAPEQLNGGTITIATDMYALGVILFHLLGGHSPHAAERATPIQLARAVLEGEPRRLGSFDPSTDLSAIALARASSIERLRGALRGDLAIIVARAMKKEPAQRYATVQALADDLRLHLENRPIAARADSGWYRLRKFARRNWLPLGAATTVLIVLLGSAILLAVQARQTAREAQSTLAVKDFLFGLFTAVDPNTAKGRDISARELLDRGRDRVAADAHGDPALQAELQAVLGRIYYELGLYPQATELQKRAILTLQQPGAVSMPLLHAQLDYASTARGAGDFDAASAALDAAAALLPTLPRTSAQDRSRLLYSRAELAVSRRDFAEAKALADRAVEFGQANPVGDYLLAQSFWTRGNAEWGLRSAAAAEADFREALRMFELIQGNDSPSVGKLHGNIAMALRAQSHYAQAFDESRQDVAIEEKTLGVEHPSALLARSYLGLTHYLLGHYREARDIFLQVDAIQLKLGGDDSPAHAGTLINLAGDLIETPDLAGAEHAYAEALRVFEKKYGRQFDGSQTALRGLAAVHVLQGRLDLAEPELQEAQSLIDQRAIKDEVANYYWQGELKRQRHEAAVAVVLDRQALEVARRNFGETGRYPALAHHYLGLALRDAGDHAQAEQELRAALLAFGYIDGAFHPWAATTRLELAQLVRTRDRNNAESAELIAVALRIREQFLGADDPRTIAARSLLVAAPPQAARTPR